MYMMLPLVLASALLPGRAERTAGAGAPRWSPQEQREVLGPCVSADSGTATAPGTVQGFPREALSVTCTWSLAGRGYRNPVANRVHELVLPVPLTWSAPEITARGAAGPLSIPSSCVLRAFRVTVECLAKEDAGTLHCGVQKGFSPSHETKGEMWRPS